MTILFRVVKLIIFFFKSQPPGEISTTGWKSHPLVENLNRWLRFCLISTGGWDFQPPGEIHEFLNRWLRFSTTGWDSHPAVEKKSQPAVEFLGPGLIEFQLAIFARQPRTRLKRADDFGYWLRELRMHRPIKKFLFCKTIHMNIRIYLIHKNLTLERLTCIKVPYGIYFMHKSTIWNILHA